MVVAKSSAFATIESEQLEQLCVKGASSRRLLPLVNTKADFDFGGRSYDRNPIH